MSVVKRWLKLALSVAFSLPLTTACGATYGKSSPSPTTASNGSRSASILGTFSPTSIITNAVRLEVVVTYDGREWTGTQLERLAALMDKGILTPEEFAAQKAELLS